ncbi:hypothetical protein GCK72_016581 [Caenorhabditis remanei]|uniref:Serpentine Receptor, class H n=1 Tax=Caenorhabditis remanei TaxID=31234 RepID=A0A6A5G586_CAERE|nr:hypothetical protein GCK72_016581 [Caenorhabditis remanei]KAF1750036.1 hypothetical protein GCK72_016581 [Caenorhabditis remanei]
MEISIKRNWERCSASTTFVKYDDQQPENTLECYSHQTFSVEVKQIEKKPTVMKDEERSSARCGSQESGKRAQVKRIEKTSTVVREKEKSSSTRCGSQESGKRSCYCDILACSLITPYFFFPTMCGFPVGLLRVLGVPTSAQTFIGIVSLLFMGISVVALFENRSSCIPSNRFRITKKRSRFLYYLFNCTVIIAYIIPPFCYIPKQESAKLFILQTIPCPTEEFFYAEVFVWTIDKFWNNYIWMATGSIVLIILSQGLFYAICCIYYLYFSTAVIISTKTQKYQRSFFLGTVAQVVVPFIFLVIPVATGISSIYFDYYNQVLNNYCVLFLSLHGFAATIIITLVHHPYRTFLIKVIAFYRSSENAEDYGLGEVCFVECTLLLWVPHLWHYSKIGAVAFQVIVFE